MTEASPKVLQTDLISRDGMEDAESGKTLQRKCAAIIAPVTLAKIYCCFSLIAVLTASVIVLSILLAVLVGQAISVLEVPVSVGCPKQWIGFGSKCFYFSEDARNWTFSQAFCVSLEADLVQFETLEELNFLKRYKGPSDHWIGLSRESSYHIWKWTDDSEYNASYVIKGVGECAYLNDNGISSARTYTDRKWICSKPNDIYRCQKSPNPF
uniref:C-type lectin domain-containing protein n=1 Tax=Equus asinus TaxID=9793 RepID=A0A9L0IP82_EQUAS